MDYQPFTAAAYGVPMGGHVGAAGAGMPATSGASPNDKGLLPWHPDSPDFWLILFAAATVFGITGAEVAGRIGKGRARVEVGKV